MQPRMGDCAVHKIKLVRCPALADQSGGRRDATDINIGQKMPLPMPSAQDLTGFFDAVKACVSQPLNLGVIECGFIVKACPAHQARTDTHPEIELGLEALLSNVLSVRSTGLLIFVLSHA